MYRSGFVLVLLQGSLFVVLANDLTSTASVEVKHGHQEGTVGPPRYEIKNAAGHPCIIMEMDAHVSFKWKMEPNKTKELDTYVKPKEVKTAGFCKDDVQLGLTWKSVQMKWIFSKTRDSEKWFAKEVEVQYINSEKKQSNSSGTSNVSTWTSRDVLLFSAPMGKAYHCAEEYSLALTGTGNDSATLLLRQFRVQPFLTGASFGPSYCPTDNNAPKVTSTTAPVSSPISRTTPDAIHKITFTATQTSVSPAGTSSSSHVSTDDASSTSDSNDQTQSEPTETPLGGVKSGWSSAQPERLSNDISMSTTFQPVKDASALNPATSLPPYLYQKMLPNTMKMPVYPPKKMFYTGVKMNNNDALSSMLWSWYSSGFYTGYYQALQQPKKTQ